MKTPTTDAYLELQSAYDFFNEHLFGSALPNCLLTLQRKSARVLGYFSSKRFGGNEGEKTDELAMNPAHFHSMTLEEVLSTLAHEMAHVWQSHLGKPSRGGYHNTQWGKKMKEIGLHPSNTGAPGGKETGDQMHHFIVSGGQFDIAAQKLLASGFHLSWSERAHNITPALAPTPHEVDRSNRKKYTCPECKINAWGKPNIKLVCGECMVGFEMN